MENKSDAYKYQICIVQRMHFQVRVGVFNCQYKILTKIIFVIFSAEMLQQLSPTL